ncbi:mucin-1-like, partial [Ylistrum balloti]|uniref:mucin-1-like n=1 Tax=Ylistrum balloti TaxID=509963 RepID=UPI002905C207
MYGCVSAEITVSNVASISPDSTTNPGPSVGVTDSPSPASKPGTSVGVLGSQTPASKPGTSVGVTGSPTPASKTGPTVGVTGNPSPASKPGTSVGVLGSQTPASKQGTSVGVTGSPTPASKTGPTVGATGSPSHSPNLGPSVGATSHLISDKTQPPSVSVMGSSTPTGKPVPNIATTKIPTSVKNQTTQTSSAVNTNFFENIQKFLLNSQATKLIQNQIGDFIKTNNVSFPISVMTPENLQKVLQLLGSGSNNLQGISQYAGLLGNFSNDLRNVTEELEQHISPQCFSHLEFLVSELLKREQWAFKMIDASGKIPAGILDGNMVWMGSYDECLKVDTEKFQGQHCTTTLSVASILGSMFDIPAGLDVHLGVCMPDSCNVSETNAVLNTLLGLLPLGENKLSASNVACSERPEYDDLAIGGFTVCGVFV